MDTMEHDRKSTVIADGYTLGPIEDADGGAVIDLFNYYIENTFAAYPERPVPYEFFGLLRAASKGYPTAALKDGDGKLGGFGMLRAHSPLPAFARTAEITYFIKPELTGRGFGSAMLACLEAEGRRQGISCILAGISSKNDGSIRFHALHGFVEVGRFRNVGEKWGTLFDTLWMEKEI
ncbi:MAG: GNAT family N-acetyltransferase [Methanofollis liminatans]|nr:GNAT family N-acetyltransferase [Methanofollis liminatans]